MRHGARRPRDGRKGGEAVGHVRSPVGTANDPPMPRNPTWEEARHCEHSEAIQRRPLDCHGASRLAMTDGQGSFRPNS